MLDCFYMGFGSDWANRVLRAAESEESGRQWVKYSNDRINVLAPAVWVMLREHLERIVRDFNQEHADKTGLSLLSIGGQGGFITVRKDRYPTYTLELFCDIPERRFKVEVRTAPNSTTEETRKPLEVISLSLGSDDNLYLDFRKKRQTTYDIAHELAADVFRACCSR
jgi:hypothetical protein